MNLADSEDIVKGIKIIQKTLGLRLMSEDLEETIENLERRGPDQTLLKCTYLGAYNVMSTFNVTHGTISPRDETIRYGTLKLLFEEVWHGMITCAVIDQFGNVDYATPNAMANNFSMKYGKEVEPDIVSAYEGAIKNLIGTYEYIDEDVIFIGWDQDDKANFIKIGGYVL